MIGIVGVGQMGLPIAHRLLGAGQSLAFHARDPQVVADLTGLGAIDARSLQGLGETCDVVVVCVYDDDQVTEVCLGPDGVLGHMAPGSILVNHTTVDPATVQTLDAHAVPLGVGVVDAAISGSPADITAGRLTLWVGAPKDRLQNVHHVLEAYADPIMHVGKVGDGQWIKLVNNALFAANVALVADAERILGGVGLEALTALGAIRHGSGASKALETVTTLGGSERLQELAGRFLVKDVQTVMQSAGRQEVDLGTLGKVASSMGGER